MTTIVVTESAEFVDSELDSLANRAVSNANATETPAYSGSHYHISVSSEANATAAATARHPKIVTSTANATATATATRGAPQSATANATATVTASNHSVISITSSADATSGLNVSPITAKVAEIANATATPTLSRSMTTIASTADATATINQALRHVTASIVSSAAAVDSEISPAALHASGTADASAVATSIRTVLASMSESADAAATVVAGGRRVMSLSATGNATEVITGNLRATTSVSSEAEATERVRTSADVIQNLWHNTRNGAAAKWSGLPFNSMIEADGVLYGAGPDGLYVMTPGADDNGTPIASQIMWDLLDMGSSQKKRLDSAYISGVAKAPFTFRVIDRTGNYTYKSRQSIGTKMQEHRAPVGRGLASSHYRFAVEQTKDFSVDRVSVDHEPIARRLP